MESSRRKFVAMTPFDGYYQNLQTSFFIFFIFAKIRHVRSKVTDTHRHIHTQRETDKPIAIGKIDLCSARHFHV